MFVCLYACMYMYVHVCICTCMYVYVCACMCLYVSVCVCICMNVYVCVCMCLYVYVCVCMCMCVCMCIYNITDMCCCQLASAGAHLLPVLNACCLSFVATKQGPDWGGVLLLPLHLCCCCRGVFCNLWCFLRLSAVFFLHGLQGCSRWCWWSCC